MVIVPPGRPDPEPFQESGQVFEAGCAGRHLEGIVDGSLNLSKKAIRCFRQGVWDGILGLLMIMERKIKGAMRNDSRHSYVRNQDSCGREGAGRAWRKSWLREGTMLGTEPTTQRRKEPQLQKL